MTSQIRPAPVRKSIFVQASQAHAFDVFTRDIGQWWPKSHKIGTVDVERPIIEPREGYLYAVFGGDPLTLDMILSFINGTECEIGKVAVWDPPSRLILIWQLTPDFKFDPNLVTEVEVLFTPEGDGTRVELEHRDLERFGERIEAMRETISGPGGWPMLLELFAEQAKI